MTMEEILDAIEDWFEGRSFITALQLADILDERPGLVREGSAEIGASEVNGEYVLTLDEARAVVEWLEEPEEESEDDESEDDDEGAEDDESEDDDESAEDDESDGDEEEELAD